MACDLDIYRTVCVRIREHDENVAQQADSVPEAGNIAGAAVWRRVLKAVKEIHPQESEMAETVD